MSRAVLGGVAARVGGARPVAGAIRVAFWGALAMGLTQERVRFSGQPSEPKIMKATVFHSANDIRIEDVPRPQAGANEAVIRITLTTICGTDLHIVRGEYPVRSGLVIGHEPVGVIGELGVGVTGYNVGDRVLVGAITPCGQCRACLSGQLAQCGHDHDYAAAGGWRFGNTINGAQPNIFSSRTLRPIWRRFLMS